MNRVIIFLLLAVAWVGCKNEQTVGEVWWDETTIIDTDNDGVPDSDDCGPNDGDVGGNEVCDGRDNDCDGEIDEEGGDTYRVDEDGDGYGVDMVLCERPSEDEQAIYPEIDCDDNAPAVHPGGHEVPDDGTDQDCNGQDLSSLDVDNDGDGYAENDGDCDDADLDIYPGHGCD
ncbi:hypothetical protein HY734_02270 [Candidatus Uhrbacteria bacterium]|nr:hypothetical protein [Candidatus Uhrbacteria bacterium]